MMLVAGVDEAGRGPLAGPVFAAAVLLAGADTAGALGGVDDSKKLSHAQRVRLADAIVEHAPAWAVASATSHEIDQLNILNATFLAMQRAVRALPTRPDLVRVDGNRSPSFAWNGVTLAHEFLVGGDGLDRGIGAASILAKVWRDQHMLNLDTQYPLYGFARHKGYPTAVHMSALREHGPCPEHRRSFRPVRKAARVHALPGQRR
jgi:ribonuclease HII